MNAERYEKGKHGLMYKAAKCCFGEIHSIPSPATNILGDAIKSYVPRFIHGTSEYLFCIFTTLSSFLNIFNYLSYLK